MLGLQLNAQTVLNNDFENWSLVSGRLMPDNWFTGNTIDTTIVRSNTSYSGNYSLELKVKSLSPGTCVNGTLASGTNSSNPGFAISTRPTKLIGYNIFSVVGGDTAGIDISIIDNNMQLMGYGQLLFTSQNNTFIYFEVPINYSNPNAIPSLAFITIAACYPSTPNLCNYAGSFLLIDQLNFIGTVGINDESTSKIYFSLYPNPTSESVTVNNATPGSKISLLDLSGQIIKQEITESSSIVISLIDVEAGIYFIEMENTGEKIVQKLIKE